LLVAATRRADRFTRRCRQAAADAHRSAIEPDPARDHLDRNFIEGAVRRIGTIHHQIDRITGRAICLIGDPGRCQLESSHGGVRRLSDPGHRSGVDEPAPVPHPVVRSGSTIALTDAASVSGRPLLNRDPKILHFGYAKVPNGGLTAGRG
jgi:hypothetical protein